MSYAVVRVQKFKAAAVGGIDIHNERKKEGVSKTNPDIDWVRTEQNYHLHEAGERYGQAVIERIDRLERNRAVRKDAVVMAECLVTSDKLFFDELSDDQRDAFFRDAYKFLERRYGAENIISATVHLDEATPHMHVDFVPVTPDGRLSAKDVLSQKSLITLHDAFHDEVGTMYGLERGESRADGKRRRHFETQEYKDIINAAKTKAAEMEADAGRYATVIIEEANLDGAGITGEAEADAAKILADARADAARIVQEVARAAQEAAEEAARVESLEKEKSTLQGEIEAQKREKRLLSSAPAKKIEFSETFGGDNVKLSKKNFLALRRTAGFVDTVNADAEKRVKTAEARAVAAESDRPSIKMQLEHAELSVEHDKLKKSYVALSKIVDWIKNRLPDVWRKAVAAAASEQERQGRGRDEPSR